MYTSHFDCNVRGPIFLTQAALPHLARGGRIVFVSSAAARLGVAGHTVYGPTKAANEALARVWAKEIGHSHGVTVNCVNPGPVATGKKSKSFSILWFYAKHTLQINGIKAMNSFSKTCSP